MFTYWFRPWTHWHRIKEDAFNVLAAAGYGEDRLAVRKSLSPPPPVFD